jgi:hypothetical protein
MAILPPRIESRPKEKPVDGLLGEVSGAGLGALGAVPFASDAKFQTPFPFRMSSTLGSCRSMELTCTLPLSRGSRLTRISSCFACVKGKELVKFGSSAIVTSCTVKRTGKSPSFMLLSVTFR